MKIKLSFTSQLVISPLLGAAVGLLLGDLAAPLEPVGKLFIKILQITIIPYIFVSLILGIGKLATRELLFIARYGLLILSTVWIITLGALALTPLLFPDYPNTSFSSVSPIEAAVPDFYQLYIPSNPFQSLSRAHIPAIVIFCICVGVSLSSIRNKHGLMDVLETLNQVLEKMAAFLFKLAPIGIFALTAYNAGVMPFDNLVRLYVYVVAFIGLCLFFSLAVLPLMAAALTRFNYRQILASARDAALMGFLLGGTFVTLPIITENIGRLFRREAPDSETSKSTFSALVPVMYNIPQAGQLIPLFFILFSAWFYDQALDGFQQISLMLAGLFCSFAGPYAYLPFLLRQAELPADSFEIYVMTDTLLRRFRTLAEVIGLVCITIILTDIRAGRGRIFWKRIAKYSTMGACGAILFGVGLKFALQLPQVEANTMEQQILLNAAISDPVPYAVIYPTDEPEAPETGRNAPLLQRIIDRGVLRVGFSPINEPFSYYNSKDDLVGYSIALAHHLADAMDCAIEFIPLAYAGIADAVRSGRCDIFISAYALNMAAMREMDFTNAYLEARGCFAVRDHERFLFKDRQRLLADKNLSISAIEGTGEAEFIREYLPNATIEIVQESEVEALFEQNKINAMIMTLPEATALSILIPQYCVVTPEPPMFIDKLAFPIPRNEPEFRHYLNTWLDIMDAEGVLESEYDKWVRGQDPDARKPRWSVIGEIQDRLE